MRVSSLHRYPVKGLSPEKLLRVTLTAGEYVPGDRLFAIENGHSGYDGLEWPDQPAKIRFLMLMRHERLARLSTRWDEVVGMLTVEEGGRVAAQGSLDTEEGRQGIAAFFESYMSDAMRGPARVLRAPDGRRFTDSRRGFVSLINLASVRALEDRLGRPVDPLRFRGNIHVEGLKAWEEFDLVGRILVAPSGLRLAVTKRIERCAATNVDPATGERDLEIPRTLLQAYGYADCGVYATVLAGGTLAEGEVLTLEPEAQDGLPFA